MNQFSRTQLLLGKSAVEKLYSSRVAVFGIGGVGGFAAEALVRSGVGTIDLIDKDKVSPSNLNRQIIATHKTIGAAKVDAAEERFRDINPNIKINKYPVFYLPETEYLIDFDLYDYVIDAIDTVAGKISIAVNAQKWNVPVISSMGAGNKLDPTAFEVADIYETSVCPLAKVMRRELRKRNIKKLKVVYSKEEPITPYEYPECIEDESGKKRIPGSVSFVPSVAGLIIAGEFIKDLIKNI
ncbi:MAG: tRNA threonylcarbamoyladenosine dehydratase [Clostridiales bacterium]|nr:tRNA threonylcarbamoyladenosine dehydratase [Clostridiales bacterium]